MFKCLFVTVLLGVACYVQAQAPVAVERSLSNSICKSRNGYYPIENECDSYIECKEYQASEMLCPDGLHFIPKAAWPDYPCGYPMEVPCDARSAPQPAKPTKDCPHQYGFYPSPAAHAGNCGQYRMCVEGNALEMMCPPGLAFNPDNAHCDWPDVVPGCKAEEFLGFKCPPAPLGEDGQPLEVVNYMYEGDCYAFYSCEHGRPRLLSCDPGYAFDTSSGHCAPADSVKCI